MSQPVIGRELRARRTAAGRTVASVAAEAGLSVPYIANLENGRGNPTVSALAQLAAALGTELVVRLVAAEEGPRDPATGSPPVPASLVRLGRTARFRRTVGAMAGARGPGTADPDALAGQLVGALTALARAVDTDLTEADWWRVLDALLLVTAHPAAPS